jgi:hemerythrin-like metal-binding protein
MPLEWKESYLIGEAGIDAQHRHFFVLANAFIAARGKAAQTSCAMAIYRHTREHFGHEEELMRRLAYPGLANHVEWHNRMISRLNALSRDIQSETVNTQDLVSLAEDWALNHIPVHDADLCAFLLQHKD